MKILYFCAIDQTVPGTTAAPCTSRRSPKARGARTRGSRAGDTRAAALPAGAGALDRRCRRRSGATQLRWARRARCAQLAERSGPTSIMERYYNFGGEGDRPRRDAAPWPFSRSTRRSIDYPGSSKALLDRALSSSRCTAGASGSAARRPDRHAERGDPAAGHAAREDRRTRVGRRYRALPPGATGAVPFRARPRPSRSLPARSAPGTARSTWSTAMRELHARGRDDIGAVFVGDGPELPRVREAPRGLAGIVFTGALPHDACRRAWRPPTSASRRSTSARTRRWRSGSTGRR